MNLSLFRAAWIFAAFVTTLRLFAGSTSLVSAPRLTLPGGNQIFYFVLTDRFANGSSLNDTGGIPGDRNQHGFDPAAISHYHGGDFVGLKGKLDYIKELGATAIWITPPFKNKAVQEGTAGYHGYWILDFTQIDPHLGTDAEFREFVTEAHARGLRVYLDIVVNHTADVISFKGNDTTYRGIAQAPYRDAAGQSFDPHEVAYNGLESAAPPFPKLSSERSFAHEPIVAPTEVDTKRPAWLNNPLFYHNRGNSHFEGENSLFGDFVGLDDLFTENPVVVRGFIEIFSHWIEHYDIDGFRIDTVKHVNLEFWQAFAPAIRAKARALGKPEFFQFGEVSTGNRDVSLMSLFSTTGTLDATLDFGFFQAVRDVLSRGKESEELEQLFRDDDLYTDHDSNADGTPTFISNHDAGRFAYFLKQDNPTATNDQLSQLVKLGYGLLFTVRGQPIVYYGDEQGMVGTGDDMGAREDMFPSQAPTFRALSLLGSSQTGASNKFDSRHPYFQTIRTLSRLRNSHPGLSRGAMLIRPGGNPNIFSFSRVDRDERVEYLVAVNNSRTHVLNSTLETSQPPGAQLRVIYDSDHASSASGAQLKVGPSRQVAIELAPLQLMVWAADSPLPKPSTPPTIAFASPANASVLTFATRSVDGHTFPVRQELRAEVTGGDGVAEVTFTLARKSRPDQYELLGTDDTPPYRVFWSPPPDLLPGDELTFIATVDDLRGHRASAQVERIKVAPTPLSFGIRGATVPTLSYVTNSPLQVKHGGKVALTVRAEGTPPVEFQWLHNGKQVSGATHPTFTVNELSEASEGSYVVQVRNRSGTVLSHEIMVTGK